MAKAPGKHRVDSHDGRFIGRVGGLAVALGIGVAIANNPGVASASEGESAGPEKSSETSESPSTPSSTKHNDPVKSIVKQLRSTISEAREKVESTREDINDRVQSRSTQRVTTGLSTVQATQIVRNTPKPPKKVPNPALVAVAGFVRREIEQAVTPARTPESSTPTAAVAQTVTTQAVSPLDTPEQREAEQKAAETANTLPVALTKLVLKTGWYVTALGEYSKVGGPDKDNLAQLSRSVDEYAMGASFQQQILNPMTPQVVMQVAPPHTWSDGQMVPGSRILYDNPDTIYRFMPVNKTSTYVIKGKFENWDPTTGFDGAGVPADTTFSLLTGLSGNTAAVIGRDDLEVNDDGTFEIVVSGESRPAGFEGNYLQLTSDSTLIAARDTLGDWNAEQPMTLSIERTSGPPNSFLAQMGIFAIPLIGPAVTDNPMLTQLVSIIPPLPELPIVRGAVTSVIMLIGITMERDYIRVATVDGETGEKREPNVFTDPTSNAAFLSTQLQSAGYFDLADDEALVLTIDKKDAGYFNVPVTNDWTITDNYWDQQSSLNNEQAKPDVAGGTTYTIVISKNDPGVYNWVSTGGLNQGTASIRFQDLGGANAARPTVSSKVVKISELDDPGVLPPGSFIPAGSTYREDQIAERQSGFYSRFV